MQTRLRPNSTSYSSFINCIELYGNNLILSVISNKTLENVPIHTISDGFFFLTIYCINLMSNYA